MSVSYERDGYQQPRRTGATDQLLDATPSEARCPGQEGAGGQRELATEQPAEEASDPALQQDAGAEKPARVRSSLCLRQVTT